MSEGRAVAEVGRRRPLSLPPLPPPSFPPPRERDVFGGGASEAADGPGLTDKAVSGGSGAVDVEGPATWTPTPVRAALRCRDCKPITGRFLFSACPSLGGVAFEVDSTGAAGVCIAAGSADAAGGLDPRPRAFAVDALGPAAAV